MTGIMNQRRCGNCHFAKLTPQVAAVDFSKRICWGAPPSAHHAPDRNGRMNLQMVRPVVSVSDDECALWRLKTGDDIAREHSDMKAVQELASRAETKQ